MGACDGRLSLPHNLVVLRSQFCDRRDRLARRKCSLFPHAQCRPRILAQPQPCGPNKLAPSMRPPPCNYPVESKSLNQKRVWHKLDQQRSEIRQAIKATTFYFYFKSGAAKRPRFDLKEKQCLKQMEDRARGHLNKSVH